MSTSATDKLAAKKAAWIERTQTAVPSLAGNIEELLSIPRAQSLRINTLKANEAETLAALRQLGWQGEPYAWAPHGYSITAGLEAIRDSELAATGDIYIQNAASWLPVIALDPQPGERILDVCAAPGGKTSHIAAAALNQAPITANDNSRPRLLRLQQNMTRLGAESVEYTLYDATALSRKLEGQQYDKILLDAPCSGEGMMHLGDTKGFESWSVAHIKRLQKLQKRLILEAWRLLEPGGTLVYSTCTMAPDENEAVVDYLLRRTDDSRVVPLENLAPPEATIVPAVTEWHSKPYDKRVSGCLRLLPSPQIEAFFVAKLQKQQI